MRARTLLAFTPFWIFLVLFKTGAGLHYTLSSTLGERVMPLWIVGVFMGVMSLVQLVLDVPAGMALDRFGYKKLLTIGSVLFLLAGVMLTGTYTIWKYIGSHLFSTFGWLIFGPGVSAYVLSQAPAREGSAFISARDVFGSLGIVIGAGLVGTAIGWNVSTVGWFIAVCMLAAFFAITLSPKERGIVGENKIAGQHYHIRRVRLSRCLRVVKKLNPASLMLLIQSFSAATFYGVIWFVAPLVIARGLGSVYLSWGMGVFDFAIVVLGFVMGKVADTMNKRLLVFLGLSLFTVTGAIIGFRFDWMFILLGFLATSGDELSSVSLWCWLHALDKDHASDGLVSGIIMLFQDLGWAVGPMAAGILYPWIGPSWTIASSATLVFFTLIVYQFLMRHHNISTEFSLMPMKPHRSRVRG